MTNPDDQQPPTSDVADLHCRVDVELTRVNSRIALLSQRADQDDEDLCDQERRLADLGRSRRPLSGVVALLVAVGLLLTLWQLAGH